MRIEQRLLRPDANNFTVVRLALACSVIYTHCYVETWGGGDADDITWLLGAPISKFAVDGFFFLSGFLVYPSLQRLGSSRWFLGARLARLWPALALSILLTVLGGLFFTSVPGLSYFSGPTARFIFGNLSFIRAHYSLTGIDCGGTVCNVNGSLWTLPIEARCYLILAGLGLVGLTRPLWFLGLILPATVAAALAWDFETVRDLFTNAAGPGPAYVLDVFLRLWPLFALGAAAYILRHRIVLSWWLLGGFFIFAICTADETFAAQSRALFEAYGVLCFGLLTAKTRALSGAWPDYSYGMYIFAAPVMVLIHAAWRPGSHWPLAAATALATLPIAAASWHWLERPALDGFKRWRASATAARAAPDGSPKS